MLKSNVFSLKKLSSCALSICLFISILHDLIFHLKNWHVVGCLNLLYNPKHPLYDKFIGPFIQIRIKCYLLSLNEHVFSAVICRTELLLDTLSHIFARFGLWSELSNSIFNSPNSHTLNLQLNHSILEFQFFKNFFVES